MSFLIGPTDQCYCDSGRLYRNCCKQLTKLGRTPSPELRYRYWTKYAGETRSFALEFLNRSKRLDEVTDFSLKLIEPADEEALEFDDIAFIFCHAPVPEYFLSETDHTKVTCESMQSYLKHSVNPPELPLIRLIEAQEPKFGREPFKSVINQMATTTTSWLKIVKHLTNLVIEVEDLLLGGTFLIADRPAHNFEIGSILCTQVLHFEGISILDGTFRWILPPNYQDELQRLAENIRNTYRVTSRDNLSHFSRFNISLAAIKVFENLTDELYSEDPSETAIDVNSDGELIDPSILMYSWSNSSVSEVANRIYSTIQRGEDSPEPEIIARASDGSPERIELLSQSVESLIIARIIVLPNEVAVVVNSRERAKLLRERLEKLSDLLIFDSEEDINTPRLRRSVSCCVCGSSECESMTVYDEESDNNDVTLIHTKHDKHRPA